jgi:hypothetical protein
VGEQQHADERGSDEGQRHDRALPKPTGYRIGRTATLPELLPDDDATAVPRTWARPVAEAILPPLVFKALAPWYYERLRKGETLRFDRIPDDVPVEASQEREYARVAPMPTAVLLLGETRTGKELLAGAIHARSRRIERVQEAAMRKLLAWPWPGNVRELGNVLERALILSDGSTLALDGNFGSSVSIRIRFCSRLKRLGVKRPASQTRSAI